jgi:hypothetical protein
MSKINIVAKSESKAGGLPSLFGREYEWSDIDQDLLRLAEFQGRNTAQSAELTVDLRRVNLGTSWLSIVVRKRDW